MSIKTEEYRTQAIAADQQAEKITAPLLKEDFFKLAEAWRHLAKVTDDYEARWGNKMPPIAQ
jgi:hypothetical protein